jgi:hypothetical protein
MPIDFEQSDTDRVNAILTECADCCPEPDCLYATANFRHRDSEICKSGYQPFSKGAGEPWTWPDAFDYTTTGVTIPLYTRDVAFTSGSHTGSARRKGTNHFDGELTGTVTQTLTAGYAEEKTVSTEHQKPPEDHASSNVPLGQCAPYSTIVPPAAPSGLTAALDTLGTGMDPIAGKTPVLLSWTDNRPDDPITTDPIGSYLVHVDGDIIPGVGFVSETERQIYLDDDDETCHEFRVKYGDGGAWSPPFPFSLTESACCTGSTGEGCGETSQGNLQSTEPLAQAEGYNYSRTYEEDGETPASASGSINCDTDTTPDPGGILTGQSLRDFGFTPDAVTHTRTATTDKVTSTWRFNEPEVAEDIEDTEATAVEATGVTTDGFGVITGGTLTTGTLTTGTITAGQLQGGQLTGGTILGGTITSGSLVGGTLTGGTISGSTLSGTSVFGADLEDIDNSTSGWKTVKDSWSEELNEETGTRYENDINTGETAMASMFTELEALVAAYDDLYGWGITLTGSWPTLDGGYTPETGAACVTKFFPQTGNNLSAALKVRMRELGTSWTVQEDHEGTAFKVLWDVAFFSAEWEAWALAHYLWAGSEYRWLNRSMPGDDDYPEPEDYETTEEYNAALDAIPKDPDVFPPSGWTTNAGPPITYTKAGVTLSETALRDLYELYADPGGAPTAPAVQDSEEWTWASTQAAVDPETVDPCDPTFAARQQPAEPVREDYPEGEEGTEEFDDAHAAWDAARLEAIERSKRTSPWFIFTPALMPTVPGHFRVCNVRHICDLENPNGIIANYDHAFPTTELPELDPTTSDPSRWADWYLVFE